MEGTLPIWLIILILGTGLLFAAGYVKPYVTKEDRAAAEAFRKGCWMGKKPPVVMVRDHLAPMASIAMVMIIAVASAVMFFIESFGDVLAHFGGGIIVGIIIVVVAFFAYSFIFMLLLIVHLIGETITSMSYTRLYRDRYGIEVTFESDAK